MTGSSMSRLASRRAALPRRVVALGGGTGLPAVLRGLRGVLQPADDALTAVVTMTDDGGSSGRLRRTRGVPPPGDVRNCLVALAEEEHMLASLFQHRYDGTEELGGHTVGNLILAALAEQSGSFLKAVEVSSHVLRTSGRILPSTQQDVRLEASLEDGSCIIGETNIARCEKRIRKISVRPANALSAPGVVEAIRSADLVVLGPGSLYTSLLPNIAIRPIAEAIRSTAGIVVLVANLVSERGEASGLDLADHLEIVEEHLGGQVVDAVLAHEGPIDPETLARYEAEGASPLHWSDGRSRPVRILRRYLLAEGPKLRHDPAATAGALLEVWASLATKRGRVEAMRESRTSKAIRPREEILTSREARELLKIGRTKLWELTRQNSIPAYRVGDGKQASLRYKRSELLAWLEQNRI